MLTTKAMELDLEDWKKRLIGKKLVNDERDVSIFINLN